MIASVDAEAGRVDSLIKNLAAAETVDLKNAQAQIKKNETAMYQLGGADLALKNMTDDKVEQFVKSMPEDQLNTIYAQVGKENWDNASPKEKKAIVSGVLANTKSYLLRQTLDGRESIARLQDDRRARHDDMVWALGLAKIAAGSDGKIGRAHV